MIVIFITSVILCTALIEHEYIEILSQKYKRNSKKKGYGLKQMDLTVDSYSDADWASCLDDIRSTSCYCVFLGGNWYHGEAKKNNSIKVNYRRRV